MDIFFAEISLTVNAIDFSQPSQKAFTVLIWFVFTSFLTSPAKFLFLLRLAQSFLSRECIEALAQKIERKAKYEEKYT